MKKCPYCNKFSFDDAENCEHCFAAFPCEEAKETPKQEVTEQEEIPVRKKTKRS